MPNRSRPGRREWRLAVVAAALTYVVAELFATLAASHGLMAREPYWVIEQSGDPVFRYDPVLGYTLSPKPARLLTVARDGSVDFEGTLRGNNYGLADRDDFTVERQPSDQRRFAVLGDSYTAAQFLSAPWPERVEAWRRKDGDSLRLLNFALDGGGLANWASALSGLVAAAGFELDGVIFAVFEDDLERTFHWRDTRWVPGSSAAEVVLGYAAGWGARPSTTPPPSHERTTHRIQLVSSQRFSERREGRLPFRPPSRLFFWNLMRAALRRGDPEREYGATTAARDRIVGRLQQLLADRQWPALVIAVSRGPWGRPNDTASRAERFAAALGARFVDGDRASVSRGRFTLTTTQ